MQYLKESSDWYLRIFIDSENGIDLDDCEKVSDKVGDILDEKDPIPTSYNLEVSSCGLERHLREKKHFEAAICKDVELKLYKAINGSRIIDGKITKVNDDEVIISYDKDKEISLKLSDISSAKILFNWEELKNE